MPTKIPYVDEVWNKKLYKRFWSYVDIRTPDECWEWQKGLFQNGYGQFRVGKKKLRTHRISFWLYRGYLPQDKCICHKCDNPKCVNPTHLFEATHKENSRDRDKKGRMGDGGSMMKRLTGMCRGTKNPAHKLNLYRVYKIEVLYGGGIGTSVKRLAKQFGVCETTIRNIIKGKTWHYE